MVIVTGYPIKVGVAFDPETFGLLLAAYRNTSHLKESIQALEGDGYFWLCYPKGTSKKYKSDINWEKTWEVMAPYEYKPVSQVAVDDDWSAMRFKK